MLLFLSKGSTLAIGFFDGASAREDELPGVDWDVVED